MASPILHADVGKQGIDVEHLQRLDLDIVGR
jgi:hypothetical protein